MKTTNEIRNAAASIHTFDVIVDEFRARNDAGEGFDPSSDMENWHLVGEENGVAVYEDRQLDKLFIVANVNGDWAVEITEIETDDGEDEELADAIIAEENAASMVALEAIETKRAEQAMERCEDDESADLYDADNDRGMASSGDFDIE
jgi:hypothetical protein